MGELNINVESPEAAPTPKKKRGNKMATMTRQQRKAYDAEKQREHRKREADEQNKTAELPNSPAECPRREAEVILGERFQHAEPTDYLISLAFDMGTIAAEKLKICTNKYFWRFGAQKALKALVELHPEIEVAFKIESVTEGKATVHETIYSTEGKKLATRVVEYRGHWEDVDAEPEDEPKMLILNGILKAYCKANETRAFIPDSRKIVRESFLSRA